jgi:hypothetical protein
MRFYLLISFLISGPAAMAQAPYVGDRDFEVRRDYLRERYADFYTKLIEDDRARAQRERAGVEMHKVREEWTKRLEAARLEYVRNRKQKVEPSPDAHEKELAEQRAARLRDLEIYKKKQAQLRAIERQVGTIPEDIEYELYPTYEAVSDPEN